MLLRGIIGRVRSDPEPEAIAGCFVAVLTCLSATDAAERVTAPPYRRIATWSAISPTSVIGWMLWLPTR